MLLAAFAADPKPSVAAREALAAQTGLEFGTTSNWFDAERKRVKAAQPPVPEGTQEAPTAEGDSPPPAPPAAMRKRKAAGPTYEPPTDDASREALLAALSSEENALTAALDEPRVDLFALLPASQLSAAAQPLLNRAVRGGPAPICGAAPRLRCRARRRFVRRFSAHAPSAF